MSDGEEDIFATAAVSHEASSLVSKWLDDSDAESSEETESPVAHAGGRNALSRLDGYVYIDYATRSTIVGTPVRV